MLVQNVETLQYLSSEATSFEDFNYDRAFGEWCLAKDRRGYLKMVKKQQAAEEKEKEALGALRLSQEEPLDLSSWCKPCF